MHIDTAYLQKGKTNHLFPRTVLLLFCLLAYGSSFGTVFTVTNLTDGLPGSFRDRVVTANASPGLDTIQFAVAGTINLGSPMNSITSPLFIDGSSAPGYVACGQPQIILNGASAGAANGIQLLPGASGSTLLALNVRSFPLNGIQFIGSNNNTVRACYVGTTQDGNTAAPNGQNGFQIEAGSDFNTIGGPGPCDGNVISGNSGQGISINGSSSNTVLGNHIGVNPAGTSVLGNGSIGILIVNGSNTNFIGGSTLNERNVIANNGTGLTGNGINIDGSAGTTIVNNYVGVDATGTVSMGNAENGIALNAAPNSIIGGTGALEGNVISNHNFHAIVLNGASNDVLVLGNTIGTNAAGTAAMGNDDSGVIVINSTNVNIGGTSAGAGNLLSGSLSEYGVFVIASSNVFIEGNLIGTDVTGTQPIPNFDGGIRIDFNSNSNSVGGTASGASNTIAFNTGYGVGVLSANCTQNLISRNSFFCNTGKGIELNGLGNNNYASPVITSFSAAGATGTAGPNDIIELYYDSTCTATCQGKDFIASVSADGAGAWSYVGALNPSGTLVALAIRTAAPVNQIDNTSEFTCQIILPVEWLSFEAVPDEFGNAMLNWETGAEEAVSHFEVERSADGLDFERIGDVAARNVSQGSSYDFLDGAPMLGTVFYRIREVDLNGGTSFSETRELHLEAPGELIQLANHPFEGPIRFRVNVDGSAVASHTLFDLRGKALAVGKSQIGQGEWTTISTEGMSAGLYTLQVQWNGRIANRTVMLR